MRVRIHYLALVPLLAGAGFGAAYLLTRSSPQAAKAAPLSSAVPVAAPAAPTIVGLARAAALPGAMATTRRAVTTAAQVQAPPVTHYVPPPQQHRAPPPPPSTTVLIPVPQ